MNTRKSSGLKNSFVNISQATTRSNTTDPPGLAREMKLWNMLKKDNSFNLRRQTTLELNLQQYIIHSDFVLRRATCLKRQGKVCLEVNIFQTVLVRFWGLTRKKFEIFRSSKFRVCGHTEKTCFRHFRRTISETLRYEFAFGA